MKAPKFKAPSFKPPSFKRAALPSLSKAADPLKGVKPSEDIEQGVAVELDAVQQGFRDRAAQEAQRFEDATDTGYYSCLVFENRAQLDAFLAGIGMNGESDLYLDGREVARKMKIDIPTGGARGGSAGRVDPSFARMVRD